MTTMNMGLAAAMVLTAALPGAAIAQPAAMAGMARCDAIADRMARLDCFDRLSQEVKAARTRPEPVRRAPPAAAGAAAPAAPPTLTGFGAETVKRPKAARAATARPVTTQGAVVADARQVGAGYWVFTLADGARWRGDELRPTFQPPRKGDRVTLRRGAMGSYFLDAGHQPSMRVIRIG